MKFKIIYSLTIRKAAELNLKNKQEPDRKHTTLRIDLNDIKANI